MATIYLCERHLLVRFWWLWWWQYLQWWDRKSSSSSPRWSKKIIARSDQWLGGESLEWNGSEAPGQAWRQPGTGTTTTTRLRQSTGKCWVGDSSHATQYFLNNLNLFIISFPVCCCCKDLEIYLLYSFNYEISAFICWLLPCIDWPSGDCVWW